MADDARAPECQGQERSRRARRLGWYEWAVLALWIGAMVFCAQFAMASAAELEAQAAILGWVLVAILLLGGLAVWGAHFQQSERYENR